MSETVEQRLAGLGYGLFAPPRPLGAYVRAVRTGNLVFTAGHGPFDERGIVALRGQVGGELTPEEGKVAAALCAVACLSSLRGEIGDLGRVQRIVKLLAFVNCAPGFDDTTEVVNGASDLIVQAFGERGIHARSAIGTSVLPKGIPVEVELIAEIEEE